MKRILFTLAGLLTIAGAYADDIAFFEETYKTKLTGIKPIGEYPDPDQFYSAIANQLGITKMAEDAASEKYGWKPDDGKGPMPAIAGRQPGGPWEIMIFGFPLNPKTGNPDPARFKKEMISTLVRIDDTMKVLSIDDIKDLKPGRGAEPAADTAKASEALPPPASPAPEAKATEPEDVAFFEKKYQTKITGVKAMEEYDDPDEFYAAIAKQLGISELAMEAAAPKFGWNYEDGKLTADKVCRTPGQWQVMISRVAISPDTKRPDPATIEAKMICIDDDKKITFIEIEK